MTRSTIHTYQIFAEEYGEEEGYCIGNNPNKPLSYAVFHMRKYESSWIATKGRHDIDSFTRFQEAVDFYNRALERLAKREEERN